MDLLFVVSVTVLWAWVFKRVGGRVSRGCAEASPHQSGREKLRMILVKRLGIPLPQVARCHSAHTHVPAEPFLEATSRAFCSLSSCTPDLTLPWQNV